ncbi:Phytanoyl-CoA dioxygenase [Pseudomonas syringae pv. papulans]|nr:Phytanoyl-CoA dioxygenase [Pseudomonas syringae pv. papulans]
MGDKSIHIILSSLSVMKYLPLAHIYYSPREFQVMTQHSFALTTEDIEAFQRDGAICLRGVFRDWIGTIADGIERNLAEPGAYASRYVEKDDKPGGFFDDYCNWQRIPEFRAMVEDSPAASVAAAVMRSRSAQFFHDHVLVKEPGAQKATPWHQDIPYYFVEGSQNVSFWIPVDPVRESTLRLLAGSHRWEKGIKPVHSADQSDFYKDAGGYRDAPDPDTDTEQGLQVLEWEMQPGDAVLFDFRTVHGARGNASAQRRRVLSLRWLGDDIRYFERPGRTSPPYPGHAMQTGQRLREDWFPTIHQGA